MIHHLDFEKPIVELEKKIAELRTLSSKTGPMDLQKELKKLEEKLEELKKHTYANLTPWQRVQIARHPKRPYTLDYIQMIFKNFVELHGDRAFADDKAMICGFGYLDDEKILVIGHQKGRDAKENIFRNFGSAHPEGYRKALRFMRLAAKFRIPIVVFIDTPGAYPGVGAEERGQAHSIAHNLREMVQMPVPIVVFVIGEGGSGGALGIGIGDRVCVLENAYYSVISPEGCAAILWKDHTRAPDAAASLKLTAKDLLELGIVDEIIPEPLGGAHNAPATAAASVKKHLVRHLAQLDALSNSERLRQRYGKFRNFGHFHEPPAALAGTTLEAQPA